MCTNFFFFFFFIIMFLALVNTVMHFGETDTSAAEFTISNDF